MSDCEDIAALKKEVADMRLLLYGSPQTAQGGLAHLVNTLGTSMYGNDRVKGIMEEVTSIKSQVNEIKNAVWKVMALASIAMAVIQIGLQFLFKVWH